MSELKNHRQAWTDKEESILIDSVISMVENGKSQRDAFQYVSDAIGRTPGAIEYHWKKIRKNDPSIMERFQGAIADALIDAVNDPQNPQNNPQDETNDTVIKEITKGATKIHRLIEQIINPGQGITLPPGVAETVIWTQEHGDPLNLYDRKYMEQNEMDDVIDYIDKSPKNARNLYMAIENGFDMEMTAHQKIRTIYHTLNKIKPNEPGYMMARGMIVMMWHTIEILGIDAEDMIGIVREMPF